MSTLKERLNNLKKESEYKTNSDLLRFIYKYLYEKEPKRVRGVTEEEFVNNTKGSFSSMIDEKRDFDPLYFYPLEKALGTSMVYILEGTGQPMDQKEQRGLRYAAYTDTKGNYEKVISEEVYLEQDEYRCTLLDYMIDYKSAFGFEFFAYRDELPVDEICQHKGGYCLSVYKHSFDDLVSTMLSVCKSETILKYLNGYYFVEKGIDPNFLGENVKSELDLLAIKLASKTDLRDRLANFREYPLTTANPALHVEKGQTVGNAIFVNFFFNQMLQNWYPDAARPDESDRLMREMFEKAIEINKVVMPAIISLNYKTYRIDKYGYVYSDGLLCGSIAVLTWRLEEMSAELSQKTMDVYKTLVDQIEEFELRITANSRLSVLNGEMRLVKHDNPIFYDFYRLMKESNVSTIAQWLGETTNGKDHFKLPDGKQGALNLQSGSNQFKEALEILSEIDSIGEKALGNGRTYSFPNLTNRSFFIEGESVTGFAPLDVKIGGRYDNLAELLASTTLISPTFFSANSTVASVASALKIYGLSKKELSQAIRSMSDHFMETSSSINADEERGKILIALAHQRALWLKLFEKEIISQYK